MNLQGWPTWAGLLFRLNGVSQRESTMTTQLDLPMRGRPVTVEMADVARQQTWGAVLTYCASKSGLPDKAVAAEMGMQDAVWSRCKSGQNSPNGEQLDAIADKERRAQLAEEKKARAAAAKQEKEDARNEACNFLHEKLTAREWGYLIDMFERSGWSGPADALRAWEAPMAEAAA